MNQFPMLLTVLFLALAATLASALAVQASPPDQGLNITLRIEEVSSGVPDATSKPGEQVIMRVIAENAEQVAGLQFEILYNASVVSVAGIDRGSLPPGFLFVSNPNTFPSNSGKVFMVLVGSSSTGVSSIDVAAITFDLVGSPGASTAIALTNVVAGDESSPPRSIAVTSIDGSIAISTPEPIGNGDVPTSTPTPTLEPTVVPTPSLTPTAPATPTPTLPTGAPPSPTSTPTLPTGATPSPTSTPTLPTGATPSPTATPTLPTVSTSTATPTLASSQTSTPALELTPTPVPTPTTPTAAQPTPTATHTPTPTTAPSNGGCGAPLGEVSSVNVGWLLLGLIVPGLVLVRCGRQTQRKDGP